MKQRTLAQVISRLGSALSPIVFPPNCRKADGALWPLAVPTLAASHDYGPSRKSRVEKWRYRAPGGKGPCGTLAELSLWSESASLGIHAEFEATRLGRGSARRQRRQQQA